MKQMIMGAGKTSVVSPLLFGWGWGEGIRSGKSALICQKKHAPSSFQEESEAWEMCFPLPIFISGRDTRTARLFFPIDPFTAHKPHYIKPI